MANARMYEPYVPSTIIKKYLVMWLAEDPERNFEDIEAITGINVRTIHDVIRGKRASVRFTTADQILTKLGYYLAWHNDEVLAEYYAAA